MIDALIFSKDRAAQLDLLLQSIEAHAPNLFENVTVLWTASQPEYQAGYGFCVGHWHRSILFQRQGDFETDVQTWLAYAAERLCFLVDDDLYYRAAPLTEVTPFSPRAGDHDYPLSVDGCIYARDELAPLLDFPFANPTQLEAGLDARRERWPHAGFAGIYPCLVGVPANRVSVSSNMPYSDDPANAPAVMNARYLAGERIDLAATLRDVEVTGAHQQVEYVWSTATSGAAS